MSRDFITRLAMVARTLKITNGVFLEFSLYDFQALVDHRELKPQK